ncbi:lipoate--protein ligase [Secundilactobacillus folii]|uniref:lipoate--protein ligase n=1 Tax=Secundilactobacillus folii TaxID=2678357 RepID=A0A7X2XUT1_9LACO|nr:lipoate--protein ligase [Secundilactobacillus folii]MTV82008.1 lipoate--protein ligase [Secundilactobacillus folii]
MKLLDISRNGKVVTDAPTVEAISSYLTMNNPFSENTLFLARNEATVVVGKYQDVYLEVDLDYLRRHHIGLLRRAAGGGAVYTDMGNFVYMFHVMEPQDQHYWLDFKHYAAPLVKTLKELGIEDVGVSGRNDITIAGQKVSGMAAFQMKNRFSLGGTLLFDVDTETAGKVLTPLRSKYTSKGFSSVKSRILDVRAALPDKYKQITVAEFTQRWLLNIFNVKSVADIPLMHLSDADWAAIDELVKTRYGNDDWNYGKRPHYEHYVSHHFDQGTVSFNFDVVDDKLAHFTLYGDFFTKVQNISDAEDQLVGTPMTESDLVTAFESGLISQVLPWMTPGDFTTMLLQPEKFQVKK